MKWTVHGKGFKSGNYQIFPYIRGWVVYTYCGKRSELIGEADGEKQAMAIAESHQDREAAELQAFGM